ncbi:MAG: hypothetical protein M1837_004255 [Sclerophora amabilis]|nr:MAG: hypothetical protein M1837_004255 [Sclerophora amabilis]
MDLQRKLRALHDYSACDIADCIGKLRPRKSIGSAPPRPYAPHGPYSPNLDGQPKVVAPASTVLFVDSTKPLPPSLPTANIPNGAHYADLTRPDTVVVMSQPPGQGNAVLGGIMAARIKALGAQGVVVHGQVRDLREIRSLDFPGDIVFCDPLEGVEIIPQDLLDAVLDLLPRMVEADDRVKEDVKNGGKVQDAFALHRSKI